MADVHAVTRSQPVFISPVTIAEMQLGAELIEDRTVRLKCLAFLRRLKRKPLLRIDAQTGEVFGSLAAQLHRTGQRAPVSRAGLVAGVTGSAAAVQAADVEWKGFRGHSRFGSGGDEAARELNDGSSRHPLRHSS